MKKIFVIISFALLFVLKILGQAQIDIPLIVTDGTININLAIGLDLTATNCIDPQLGESDLPPVPPTGMFDVRFDLAPYGCPGISSYKDYRAPGNPPAFPFTGMIEHTLWWQTSGPALPINITYNLPPGTLMFITDQIGGSFLSLGPFVNQGTAIIPGTFTNIFSKAFLKMQYNNIGGDPGGPVFGISSLSLNFPQIIVGSDTSLPVTVTNYGLSNTLTISNIVSSNSHFTISPNVFPINIAPMASEVFQVTNTSASNAEQGTIQFTHNAYGSPTVMNVSAPAGIEPGPIFGISTTFMIFPQRNIGSVDSLPVTISNNGFINTLYINNITSSNNYFSIYPNSVPIAIGPQSFQTFFVSYTSADTLQQGTIEFTHNAWGSPAILNVKSINPSPEFSISPASLYFSAQPMTKTTWLTNNSSFDTLIIFDITLSNFNYTINPVPFPVIIPPGSTEDFHISLNNAPGFQFGVAEFIHNAAGSPSALYLSNQLITPMVEGTITVSSSYSKTLSFGLHPFATDNLDEIFDEHDLPPFPPPGVFDARFLLPENNFWSLSSYRDIRFGSDPFTEQVEYRISYQPNTNSGIVIGWNLPPELTGVIQDIVNGTFINVPIAGSGSFTVPNPEIFTKLKMLINYNSETPVELVSFNATLLDNIVRLDWTTATETNNSGFEVQRLKNYKIEKLQDWEAIGFVPGFGTTTEPKSYSFTDEAVTTGIYKYRLKQIDFDGTITYSNEIEVVVDFTPKEFVLYQNYPNPFNPSTTIKFTVPSVIASEAKQSQFVTLKIYDILGNEVATLVSEEKQPGVYEVEFSVGQDSSPDIASGIYFYQLKAGSFSQTKKMVLLK